MTSENPPAGGSLEDRISRPEPAATEDAPKGEASAASDAAKANDGEQKEDAEKPADLGQTDGAAPEYGGSGLNEPEYTVNVKLSDQQADPNNPLFSIKDFNELGIDEAILHGLRDMNFRRPSKIQERALPLLLHDPPQNMIGQSQSGTGKTAAFVLNILSRLDMINLPTTPQALVLAPTRELARQIVGVVEVMGSRIAGLTVGTLVPMDSNRNKKVDSAVVIGTPGTVQDLIKKRLFDTKHVKVLVLDEADNMLDQQGFGESCIRVKQFLPKTTQLVLFSATFPDHVVAYANKFAPQANQITLKHEELTVDGIKQLYLDCDSPEHKYEILVKFYGLLTIGSSIIFVKTRNSAAEIERRMTAEGHSVASLTGGIEGQRRDEIIDKFRDGNAKVLITTNVLARGIDVQTVSMVINYDIPELHLPREQQRIADPSTYLHRIGRTGRFGRTGVAVSFVSNKVEWSLLQDIVKYFNCDIMRLDPHDWDEVEEVVTRVIKPKGK